MRSNIRTYVVPVLAGTLSAFFVMMVFEYVNSHFYPLPADLNWKDADAVEAFTASLPWKAYVLVLMGWVVGSTVAGYVTARLARVRAFVHVMTAGGILTLMGLVNNMMLGHSIAFNIMSLPIFGLFSYFGYTRTRRSRLGQDPSFTTHR